MYRAVPRGFVVVMVKLNNILQKVCTRYQPAIGVAGQKWAEKFHVRICRPLNEIFVSMNKRSGRGKGVPKFEA